MGASEDSGGKSGHDGEMRAQQLFSFALPCR